MARVEFIGSMGDMLAAKLDMPSDGEPIAYALFAHCFTGTKDILASSHIAKTLVRKGLAVLRFDFTGLGDSEGEFENTNFTSNVEDLIAAAQYLKDHHAPAKLLIGHSLGGSAALVAASKLKDVKAIATLGAPADAAHVIHNFNDDVQKIRKDGKAEVRLAGRPFTIKRQFIHDLEKVKMDEHIENLHKALLVMHAPLDNTVGIQNAAHIFKLAKHPRSYVSLDDSDHLITRREHAEYAGNVIAAWASRYIKG